MSLGAVGMQLAAQAASMHIFHKEALITAAACWLTLAALHCLHCCCCCLLSVSVHPCWLLLLLTSQVPVPFRRLPAIAVKNS